LPNSSRMLVVVPLDFFEFLLGMRMKGVVHRL
jgi:hypothetical protein